MLLQRRARPGHRRHQQRHVSGALAGEAYAHAQQVCAGVHCLPSQDLIEPLLAALPDASEANSAGSDGPALSPVAAFFVLSRLCHSFTYRPLLAKLVTALLGVSEGAQRRRCILGVVSACGQRDLAASALCLLAVFANNSFADDKALGAFCMFVHVSVLVSHACPQTLRGCCPSAGAKPRSCSACSLQTRLLCRLLLRTSPQTSPLTVSRLQSRLCQTLLRETRTSAHPRLTERHAKR